MRIAWILLLLASSALGGCAVAVGAAGGFATVKYLENEDVREVAATIPSAHAATLGALAELGYPPPAKNVLGPAAAEIDAGDADVGITPGAPGRVRIAVRVGTFETDEHRRRAAAVHDALGRRLARPPAGP